MKYVDLHVHSTASDGSLTPTEVIHLANEAGLTAVALTDHDTVSGISEAIAAADQMDLQVVPGVELSCIYKVDIFVICRSARSRSSAASSYFWASARKISGRPS